MIISWVCLLALSAIAAPPTANEIERELGLMVQTEKGTLKASLLEISPPVEDLVVARLLPPYREFPNFVVFQRMSGGWKRVVEGIGLGISREETPIESLHYPEYGLAFDARMPKKASPEKLQEVIGELARQGTIVVPYDTFMHNHPAGKAPYFLSKRGFEAKAAKLFGAEYLQKNPETCRNFYVPGTLDMRFQKRGGRFELTTRTSNGQTWTASFRGVGRKGRLDGLIVDLK